MNQQRTERIGGTYPQTAGMQVLDIGNFVGEHLHILNDFYGMREELFTIVAQGHASGVTDKQLDAQFLLEFFDLLRDGALCDEK